MKSLLARKWVQTSIGVVLAEALRLVRHTNRVVVDPVDAVDRYRPLGPFIGAMWHGQHFLSPFAKPPGYPSRVMISRSKDGEINAVAARRLGLDLIRASGGRNARQIKKRGGSKGYLEALASLREGCSVAMTADVPKGPARQVGDGIVHLASRSQAPVLPFAVATSRRIVLERTWDRSTVNLPFGRMAIVYGEPFRVPADLDDTAFEAWREVVRRALDAVTDRAYAIADERAAPTPPRMPNPVAAVIPKDA